ncbi:MAG TPA: hypothetical protein VN231_11270 [Allosphingosinicella sp.]|nr:hypothetical protein [Allosphingosinicella sp.]
MEKKVFAFKLADKNNGKWKAREGVSLAGCTDPTGQGLHRYMTRTGDNGVWC